MVYEPSAAAAFRERLLTHPGERQEVDYKAAQPFGGDTSFSLKLMKHIQGMANAGGGWLIIGMSDTATGFVPDPVHSSAIHASYDPTLLSQKISSCIASGQQIKVTVHAEKHPNSGLFHPVIQVHGFERLPVVCGQDKIASDSNQQILRKGAVYLRRPGAETVAVSTPQDWEEVIEGTVKLRRDELLSEFRVLFERMTGSPQSSAKPDTEDDLRAMIASMRQRATKTGEIH